MTTELVKYLVSAFVVVIGAVYLYRYQDKHVGYIMGVLAFIPNVNFVIAFTGTFLVFVYALLVSINIVMDKFEK